jgi:hypothetical protein
MSSFTYTLQAIMGSEVLPSNDALESSRRTAMHLKDSHIFSASTGTHTENTAATIQQTTSPDISAPRLKKLIATTPEMLVPMFTNRQVLKELLCSIATRVSTRDALAVALH